MSWVGKRNLSEKYIFLYPAPAAHQDVILAITKAAVPVPVSSFTVQLRVAVIEWLGARPSGVTTYITEHFPRRMSTYECLFVSALAPF